MAKDKHTILVYADWLPIFEELEDDEAGRLIKHFFRYVNDRNPVPPDRITKLLFEPIKLTLKRDLKRYEDKCLKNRDNALVRWDKQDANASERISTDANHADKDKDKDKDKEINILFDVFWNLYNKKVGDKKRCEKKWNSFSDSIRQRIMDTLPAFLTTIKDKQYQPYPETYLNQERWNDEITPAKSEQSTVKTPHQSYIDNDWEEKKLKAMGLR